MTQRRCSSRTLHMTYRPLGTERDFCKLLVGQSVFSPQPSAVSRTLERGLLNPVSFLVWWG